MNTRKNRAIILITMLLVLIVHYHRQIYTYLIYGETCKLELNDSLLEIKGVVTRKYFDEWNHNFKTIDYLEKKDIKKQFLVDTEYKELWKNIQVHDSIIKRADSHVYLLKNKFGLKHVLVKYNCKK
jgi:hypothetical protein